MNGSWEVNEWELEGSTYGISIIVRELAILGISLIGRQRKKSEECYSPQWPWLHFWNLSQAEVQAYLGLIL